LLALEKNPNDTESINKIFRASHTIKSSSSTMGFMKISELAHKIEDVLDNIRSSKITVDENVISALFKCYDAMEKMIEQVSSNQKEDYETKPLLDILESIVNKTYKPSEITEASENSYLKEIKAIKVSTERLDNLMNLVGELLITRMRLDNIVSKYKLEELDQAIAQLSRLVEDIQYEVIAARLVPVEHIFSRFPRMVRDLAKKESKEIELIVEGGEIELDRTVLDEIGEPLIHLLRNSVDHGIESPEERKQQGKNPKGVIKLSAKRQRNSVVIEVEDDGHGFDLETIKKTVIEKNIATKNEIENLSIKDLMKLPFSPKFTTTKKATEISGRGVGLDAVKNKIYALNGSVKLESEAGKGAKISMELPITLAIVPCFIVSVSNSIFAIPMNNIVRSLRFDNKKIRSIEGNEVIIFENQDIPLLRVSRLFGLNEPEYSDKLNIIVIEKAGERAGLVVDNIIGKQEIIVKTLDRALKPIRGFAGATILGEGKAVLVLDIGTLV
jgi:two-component system chemotaxis sensor kinase CheA